MSANDTGECLLTPDLNGRQARALQQARPLGRCWLNGLL